MYHQSRDRQNHAVNAGAKRQRELYALDYVWEFSATAEGETRRGRPARTADSPMNELDKVLAFEAKLSEARELAVNAYVRGGTQAEFETFLDAEAATSLALAILTEPVTIVVTREPRAYRHQRVDDLPRRLQLLTPAEVVERLEIGTGEQPPDPVPTWNLLSQGPAWWVPA